MINSKEAMEIFKRHNCDRYAKKLKASQLVILFILAYIEKSSGNRNIKKMLINNKKLMRRLNLANIHHTSLYRRLNKFPIAAIEEIFGLILKRLLPKYLQHDINLLDGLNLIDSSTITRALKGMEWAKYKCDKAGVKLHLALRYQDKICHPSNLCISPATGADVDYLKELVIASDSIINVFDRGYLDYKIFDELDDNGILFVTRLRSNNVITVVESFEIPARPMVENAPYFVFDGLAILGGKPIKTRNTFRYIEVVDGEGKPIRFVTNVLNKTAEEISETYKLRWQIEVFFKWIKQNLDIKHFYSTSPDAIAFQIYIAMIAYCLIRLVSFDLEHKVEMRDIAYALKNQLYEKYKTLVKTLLDQVLKKNENMVRKKRDAVI